ncbi:MAG TPA: M28 family peptidase [Bryobacteraceae bacterium]|nr:M28 family peptidase [Bryobacteraceae bacterium]
MKRVSLAALVAFAAIAQTPTITQQIAARLTANDLKADVSFLASDALEGRGTPSRGLEIAAEFIASQFRRAGLDPAGDDGYFQTAPYASVAPNLDGLDLTLEIGGKTLHADKASIGPQEAAALDLKQGGAWKVDSNDPAALDALTPEQVKGKVLVVDMSAGGPQGRGNPAFAAMRRLAPAAVKLQPALLLLIRPNGQGVSANSRLREMSAAAPSVPILAVWDPAFRSALGEAKPGELDAKISAHIAAPTATPVKLRNVVGVLRGSDAALKDTYVLITGHYDHLGMRGTGEGDHIFNGANDDASGTSSVIEIAHTLASLPAHPKRSIVFIALFGEELGLFGSRYYAQHPIFPLAKTVADINLEQLGRTDVDGGTHVGIVNVTGYDFTSLTEEFKRAGNAFDIQVQKDEKNSDPFFARSDNQAFADAGVPAHTLSVGYVFPDYHQVGDEWPKIDYENMAKVARTVALAILDVADNPIAPSWNASNPKTERYVKAHEALVK